MSGSLQASWRIDLHLHSDRSDGRFRPEEVLARCARSGLDLIALTDHDLGSELRPGSHTVDDRRIHVVAGAEVSGLHEGREYHLLVYFPAEIPQGFREFCRLQCQERATRYAEAARRLGLDGIPDPSIEAVEGHTALTRHHLARAMVDAGHVTDLRAAFSRYLSDVHGNVPKLSLPFTEAIRVARSFGGITSWAHPPLGAVKAHVGELAAAGLQGLEVLRPYVSSKDRKALKKQAKRHGLFLTGGSDWHGWNDTDHLGLFELRLREIGGFMDCLLAA